MTKYPLDLGDSGVTYNEDRIAKFLEVYNREDIAKLEGIVDSLYEHEGVIAMLRVAPTTFSYRIRPNAKRVTLFFTDLTYQKCTPLLTRTQMEIGDTVKVLMGNWVCGGPRGEGTERFPALLNETTGGLYVFNYL